MIMIFKIKKFKYENYNFFLIYFLCSLCIKSVTHILLIYAVGFLRNFVNNFSETLYNSNFNIRFIEYRETFLKEISKSEKISSLMFIG